MDGSTRLTCPECGGANDCQFGKPESCWCNGRPVSKEALEAAHAAFGLDKSCLCRACLRRYEEVEGLGRNNLSGD